ncbi:MAG: hypothetical protein KF894_16740 [Labilithrix sp.]|nr:hypothetical protein [Labilithrix sp.]
MLNQRILGALLALTLASFVIPACSSRESLGFGVDEPPPVLIPSSDAGGAGSEGDDAEAPALVPMCASATCQAPFDTCADSKFLCDIDLSTDPLNCGSCGNACPTDLWRTNDLRAEWKCVGGACQMTCASQFNADCNNRIEDGCETQLGTNQNCGGCGDVCPDGSICEVGACKTCKANEVLCMSQCVNLDNDSNNCGECFNSCPSFPPGFPAPPPQMAYGCENRTCNHLKCAADWLDCNGDLADGCEVNSRRDPMNCGGCGKQCAAGEACINGTCQCDPGPSGCDCLPDFETDVQHCGSCGLRCSDRANSTATCEFGRCGLSCRVGYSDCNQVELDGCEVDIFRDPRNCGACGVSCETGQACIDGACATEPCPDGVLK